MLKNKWIRRKEKRTDDLFVISIMGGIYVWNDTNDMDTNKKFNLFSSLNRQFRWLQIKRWLQHWASFQCQRMTEPFWNARAPIHVFQIQLWRIQWHSTLSVSIFASAKRNVFHCWCRKIKMLEFKFNQRNVWIGCWYENQTSLTNIK